MFCWNGRWFLTCTSWCLLPRCRCITTLFIEVIQHCTVEYAKFIVHLVECVLCDLYHVRVNSICLTFYHETNKLWHLLCPGLWRWQIELKYLNGMLFHTYWVELMTRRLLQMLGRREMWRPVRDDILKRHFAEYILLITFHDNCCIEIPLKFALVPVQRLPWCLFGAGPIFEVYWRVYASLGLCELNYI